VAAPTTTQNGFTLPGGGGYQVCGLYDLRAAKVGQVQNEVVPLTNYTDGEQGHCAPFGVLPNEAIPCNTSDFISASFIARFAGSGQLGGGFDTGRIKQDNCFVANSPQQLVNCDVVLPWAANTQLKINGSLPLPAGFNVSGVYINVAGPIIRANFAAPNALIAPSLGRNLGTCGAAAVCSQVAVVPLIKDGTQYEDRRSQLDLRASKALRVGRTQCKLNLDVYNVFNNAAILQLNTTFGSSWRRPTSILDGRVVKIGGEISF
jgi:hypothetical protein